MKRYVAHYLILMAMMALAGTHPAHPEGDTLPATAWLALGDSYTIGQSVAASERYPVQAAELLRKEGIWVKDPEIIAWTGWTTRDLLNALQHKQPVSGYGIVTLLIGVNNQYQGRSLDEYKTQFAALLEQSIRLAGSRPGHVIVLSVPDYSVTPFAAGANRAAFARDIDGVNVVNKQLSDRYGVRWLDVTTASRQAAINPALVAADSLHFSGMEYRLWAAQLALLVKQALQ
jgi:lysophospholipase L1-like esterase